MRRPVPLLPLLLLTLALPTATADVVYTSWSDPVHILGNGAALPGIGAFALADGHITGTHVTATTAPDGLLDVRLEGEPMLESLTWQTGEWHLLGPIVTLYDPGERGSLSIHDNEFGWISLRAQSGNATFIGTEPWTVDPDRQGATSGTARVHLDQDGELSAAGATLTATFEATVGLVVTRADGPNIHDHAPRAGAWAKIALGPSGDATAEWMLVRSAPFWLADWRDGILTLNTVGTIGEGAEDLLLRLDLSGLEPGTPRPILRAADRIAAPATLESLLGDARGPFSFHATDGAVWIRLPAGLSGRMTLEDDRTDPTFSVGLVDIDPWAPHERVPMLIANADEPGTAVLQIGDSYEKRTLRTAFDHTFRLIGLEPGTDHDYTVTFTDLAGNQATRSGTFHTGPAVGGDRHINATAQRLGPGTFRIVANVTDETGAAVTAGVAAFVDKQAVAATFDGQHWHLALALEPGTHEIAIEAAGLEGRTREVLHVEATAIVAAPEAEAPGPGLVSFIGLILAACLAARKHAPPQP